MATSTYTPIVTTTLGSAANSVTFSSIPSTYTDLVLVVANANHSYAGTTVVFDSFAQFNSDTATNYSTTTLTGDGSSAASGRSTSQPATQIHWADASASPMVAIMHVQNYANTTTYKTTLTRANTASGMTSAYVSLWRSTAAINNIKIVVSGGYTISAGSTFTLYGIAAA